MFRIPEIYPMTKIIVWTGVALASCLFWVTPSGAEDQKATPTESVNFEYKTVTTKEGLVFRVPDDMPIETRNGVTGPIPFDEYVYAKFKKLESRIATLETKVADLESQLVLLKTPKSKERTLQAK